MAHDFDVKFLEVLDNGTLIDAEWTTPSGERVRGSLRVVGWSRPPASGIVDVINRQKRTPRVTVRPAHAGPKG